MDYTFEDAIQPYNEEIESLRQQLAVKDLEVMKLRSEFSDISKLGGDDINVKIARNIATQAISTTFTPENLMAWLGEPVAWYYKDASGLEKRDFLEKFKCCPVGMFEVPLYAPKLDMKG
jgi:hypothetical protein